MEGVVAEILTPKHPLGNLQKQVENLMEDNEDQVELERQSQKTFEYLCSQVGGGVHSLGAVLLLLCCQDARSPRRPVANLPSSRDCRSRQSSMRLGCSAR